MYYGIFIIDIPRRSQYNSVTNLNETKLLITFITVTDVIHVL